MSYYRYDSKYGLEYGQGTGESVEAMYQRTYPDVVPITHSMTREEAEQTYFDLRRSEPKPKKTCRKPNAEAKKPSECSTGFCKR